MTQDNLDAERERLVALAMKLIEQRGAEITRATLAVEAQVSRARVDAVFPEESDLFDAIVEDWFAVDVTIMEEVIASDLPVRRKFYEFFARRFQREQERFHQDPETFALYCELGAARFEHVRGYIDLADHYLSILIAEAQSEGFFSGLTIAQAMTLINQMVVCYTSPQLMMMLHQRLKVEKLAAIIDTLFAGLSAEDGGAKGVAGLRIA